MPFNDWRLSSETSYLVWDVLLVLRSPVYGKSEWVAALNLAIKKIKMFWVAHHSDLSDEDNDAIVSAYGYLVSSRIWIKRGMTVRSENACAAAVRKLKELSGGDDGFEEIQL